MSESTRRVELDSTFCNTCRSNSVHTMCLAAGAEICFHQEGEVFIVGKSKIEALQEQTPGEVQGRSPRKPQTFTAFSMQKTLNFLYFNIFFLQILTYGKKLTWAIPLIKKWGPGKAPRVYNTKYRLNLFCFILFYLTTDSWTIPDVKSGGPGGKAPGSPGLYSIFNAKDRLNLLYSNIFFLQIRTYGKKLT